MKKNADYVGVDEKYIPDEEKKEKYVDNSSDELKDEVVDTMKGVFKATKNYASNKEIQEKFIKTGKKGLKIVKGLGIGYLIIFGVVILIMISSFIFVFSQFGKTGNFFDSVFERTSEFEVNSFNSLLEMYSGTESGADVRNLLDHVVTSNKTEDRIVSVVFDNEKTSDTEKIVEIKKEIEDSQDYEVSMDYDDDGFIYLITIEKY